MYILVTGANGFVGKTLCRELMARGYAVRCAVRSAEDFHVSSLLQAGGAQSFTEEEATVVPVGDVGPETDWSDALEQVECVVHLAARVHVIHENRRDTLDHFRAVNTTGTLRLAEQAITAGVSRFVFVSTIKVNGETTDDRPFRADDAVAPAGSYAISKLEAERGLEALDARGLGVVIVRPPLVYGPGVKGNMLRLFALAARGIPVPFGAIHNQRDLVGVRNLADLLCHCVKHPAACGRTFLVCDGEPLSTADMYRAIARALGREAHLIPVPAVILRSLGRMFGHTEEMRRLTESLEIDASPTRTILDWRPPVSFEVGLAETARWFFAQNNEAYQ